MKIEVFTFCWNERDILPWAMASWRRYADRVTVFDNGSNDGSREMLQAYGCKVEDVRSDHLDNKWLRDMKNECWKYARKRADLVVVADMDEIIGGRDPRRELERMHQEGGTVCRLKWYNLMWDERPAIVSGQTVEQSNPLCCYDEHPKTLVFNPNTVGNINYGMGAHQSDPKGVLRWWEGGVYLFHVNHGLSLADRIADYKRLDERRGQNDRARGFGCHYGFSESRIRQEWAAARAKAVNLRQVLPQ